MLGSVYCIDSILLLGATFILIKTLNEDFSGTSLQNETLVLKVIFFVFTIGYVGQAILYMLDSAFVILDFSTASKAIIRRRNLIVVFQMLLDIFPILS
jgi:hypothetical protein